MKRTGPFIISEFKIPIEGWNEDILMVPFGDVHRTTKRCHEEKWHEQLDWMKVQVAKGKPLYVLGMGDYDDFLSASERFKIHTAGLHETTEEKFDEILDRHVKMFYEEIKFLKGHIIGLIEGNHHGLYFKSGITSTQRLCQLLECDYLGGSALIKLHFKRGSKCLALVIYAHHGKGGGRTAGSSVNSVEQMTQIAEADIYLQAHDHKKWIYKQTRLRLAPKGLALQERQMLFGRTGSFLRAYVPGTQGYVSEGMMKPADMGVIKVIITPKRTKKGGVEKLILDLHGSI